MVTGVTDFSTGRLFFVTDCTTGHRFLVDTGAKVIVIPPSHTNRKHTQTYLHLQAISNMAIASFSNCFLTLDLGLCRSYHWIFIIADVKNPILDADFLQYYNLVDSRHEIQSTS